jgi:plastocyanin
MKRILARLVALSLLGTLVFAPSAWAQDEVTVNMEDNFFDPAQVTVEPGTTVTWVQSGDNGHTTTSYDGLWDSGLLAGGSDQTFSFTFDDPGTYDYYCIPHEDLGMVGTVTVSGAMATPAATATPTPTPTPTPAALAKTGGLPSALLVVLGASVVLAVSGVTALALLRRRSAS